MGKLAILLGMLQLIGFFRGINLDNDDYKFGKGNFWRVTCPLGFFLGLLISKAEKGGIIPWILGIVFTIALSVSVLLVL